MDVKTIDLVAGARPNFMKLAPVLRGLRSLDTGGGIEARVVHTGQHYDHSMSQVFFDELGIPAPHAHLDVGSGSHGAQTARILERYEAHLMEKAPDATVVFGDVNSTVACALAAVKLGVPVAHVEAGLRSFDRSMPEEINRLLTDSISSLLLVSESSGVENLRREGIDDDKIRFVGNVMIDTLLQALPKAQSIEAHRALGLEERRYALLTLHRPSNVDDKEVLKRLLDTVVEISKTYPVVFPVHPRTRNVLEQDGLNGILSSAQGVLRMDPQPYLNNLSLMAKAGVVLTDSGGMQEEASFLRVPCLTLRDNTERPVTVEMGSSRLVGNDPGEILRGFRDVVSGDWPKGGGIPLWDGHAGERVARELAAWIRNS